MSTNGCMRYEYLPRGPLSMCQCGLQACAVAMAGERKKKGSKIAPPGEGGGRGSENQEREETFKAAALVPRLPHHAIAQAP